MAAKKKPGSDKSATAPQPAQTQQTPPRPNRWKRRSPELISDDELNLRIAMRDVTGSTPEFED